MLQSLKNIGRTLASTVVTGYDEPAKPSEASASVAPVPTSGFVVSQPASSPQVMNLDYDPEMLAVLQRAIANRKSSYTTLLDSAKRLEGVITDPIQRLKAAFVTSEGRTLIDITKAIDVHISDLEGERLRFKRNVDAQIIEQCTKPRNNAATQLAQVSNIEQQIAQLNAQIVSLQQQAQVATETAANLQQQADEAEQGIQVTSVKFDKAVDYAKKELASSKDQLSTILI